MMYKYLSKIAQNITPYVPGEQPKDKKYIKLNTNENPYGPSPKVIKAINKAANDDLRLYPDPNCDDLRKTIAQFYNIEADEVFVGNGSDEVLAFSFVTFFNPGNPVIFPDITYSFYPVYAKLFNIDYETVSLNEDFSIPVDKFLRKNGGIIIPNPNAPTAKYMDVDSIIKILEFNKDTMVIIDEAYIDFGGKSVVDLIHKYPNLLVVQTFSKSRSLAGVRLGFAMGQKHLIDGLNRVKNSMNSYTIDRIALAAGIAAFKDVKYFKDNAAKIIKTRNRISEVLKEMGFTVIDSKANFIFISHPQVKGETLFKKLKENGVLVRYFNAPRIDNYLRVSIGTDEEMDKFVEILKKVICSEPQA